MEKNIDLIQFVDSNWVNTQNQADVKIWENDIGDLVSLNFFPLKPDLPASLKKRNLSKIRKSFRHLLYSMEKGMVSVDIITVTQFPCLEVIIKQPQQPTGMTYIGSITIPFQDFSFVIKYVCQEYGMTGLRDTIVNISHGEEKRWFRDPYDPRYDQIAMYNLSDRIEYDSKNPTHPLSRVRRYLSNVENVIQISPELTNYPLFEFSHKSWWQFWR